MQFLNEDEEPLKKYNDIWSKFSNSMKKTFDSGPIYNKKFLNTKIKSSNDEVKNYYDNEIPEVVFSYTCLTVVLIDFVLKRR